jgi:type II secretory pathway component PulM
MRLRDILTSTLQSRLVIKGTEFFHRISQYLSGIKGAREATLLICISVILLLVLIPNIAVERAAQGKLDRLKAKFSEFSSLTAEYSSSKAEIDATEQRGTLIKVTSMSQAIEFVLSPLNNRTKIKSIKTTGNRTIAGSIVEETAEIQIDKVSLNELVNLLYKADIAPVMFVVKKITIWKDFENPALLDVTITTSYFTKSTVAR